MDTFKLDADVTHREIRALMDQHKIVWESDRALDSSGDTHEGSTVFVDGSTVRIVSTGCDKERSDVRCSPRDDPYQDRKAVAFIGNLLVTAGLAKRQDGQTR